MKILACVLALLAQYNPEFQDDTLFVRSISATDSASIVLTMEEVLKVAMSENVSVMVADKEVKRKEYAKKGTYAALYPQIDASAMYQRTLQKQVMYMDSEGGSTSSILTEALMPYFTQLYSQHPGLVPPDPGGGGDSNEGMTLGRWNTWGVGVTASMPLVNAQLWTSLKISADDVELAVEKARASRLDMVTEVKTAFYEVLLAKESAIVYEKVYENARKNLEVTQLRFNAQKISEMELLRAKTTVANAIPAVYNARNLIDLSLWQLKAVMGVDLDFNMDIQGSLKDFTDQMFYDVHRNDEPDLSRNSSLKQLEIQVEEMAKTVKLNQMAYVPSLSLAFNYNYSASANDFNFSQYQWTPYSYVGLNIAIPIFSGGKRLSNVKQSQVQYEELRLQKTQTERQLKIAVKSDLSTMETYMNSYYASQSAVKSAQKSYDVSQKSYEVGRSTLVELNASMVALAEAELNQWQNVYYFLKAKADLEKQLGQDYIIE